MRQTFETEAHKADELKFAQDIEAKRGVSLHPTKKYFPFDFVVMKDGRLLAFAEVKIRRVASTQYPTLMVSKSKFDKGASILANCACWNTYQETGLLKPIDFLVFCRYLDRDAYYKFQPEHKQLLAYGGMSKPRDPDDSRDILWHIPIELFKPV